jgi:SpoVK/Ycf46/Vps4 family AAA+-type ATPase
LPGLEAREKILRIVTKEWIGLGKTQETEEGKEGEQVKLKAEVSERIGGLANLTKGYGGADLRV